MRIRRITAEERLALERGSVVVCVYAVEDGPEELLTQQALASILSVVAHTDASTRVLVSGTVTRVTALERELAGETLDRTVLSLALAPGATAGQAVDMTARATLSADLVLLRSGVQVSSQWLERLRAAALSDSTVASATPLSLGVGGVELFDSGHRVPVEASGLGDRANGIEQLAQRVSTRSWGLYPRIATVGPGCAYIRRPTLEVVGPLEELHSWEDTLAQLAAEAIAAGMIHVAADDVLIVDRASHDDAPGAPNASGAPSAPGSPPSPEPGDRVAETIVTDEHGRLRRALAIARVSLQRLSVTIDGRALTSTVGGTQTYILDLILALAREDIALRVLVPPDLSERAAAALETVPAVETVTYEEALNNPRLTDVVHRPQSVFTPEDMTLLRLVGERVVIGQLDLIGYHNPTYHRDVDSWRAYRRTTRLALAAADQVIFFSEHARRDALAEDLLSEQRTHVVGVGTEVLHSNSSPGAPPEGLSPGEAFLLCLGADYAHKNRAFAIELLGGLRELGWAGRMVLAGAHVPFGSSAERERALLESRPDLAEHVLDAGPVEEQGKSWLYRHARALVYPTLYEGLGLLPFEAAQAGLPCLFASQASLAEVAGRAATLVPWDAAASAKIVLPLLADGPERDGHLSELHSLSAPSWAEVAGQLVAVYEQAVGSPAPEAAIRSWQELDRERYIVRLDQDAGNLKIVAQEYQDAYHELEQRVAPGLPLIDRDGLLSHAQQRGLMRIAGRRRLGALLLAPFGLLGRPKTGRRDRSKRPTQD
jgi:glycosyltransferase involved in cell wall biosynthesis